MAKSIAELKDDRAHKLLSAKDILTRSETEKRELTSEEQVDVNALMSEADAFEIEIENVVKAQACAEELKNKLSDMNRPGTRRGPAITQEAPQASTQIIPMRRCGTLQAFTSGTAEQNQRNAFESGMYLCAELFPPAHPLKEKARRWCQQAGTYQQIQNALAGGTPTAGGSLVPDAMSASIIDLREQYGVGRQWAEIMPMSSDVQIVPRRVGSPSASFVGENVAITESEPTFNNITFTAKKLGILTRMSTELSEDAVINVADYLTRDMAWAFALKEDQCLFTGDASATYGGITGLTQIVKQAGHSASYVDVATATHNTFQELDNTDLTTLMAALPAYARSGGRGCAWFISQYGADLTFGRLKAVAGGNTIDTLAMGGITQLGQRGIVGSYLGYPVVVSQVMPSTGTLTSLPMLAFGNLSLAGTIADRRAISFATDGSRYFDQDQIAIRCTERIDIILHDMGDTSTAGPIVVLKAGTS